eukprot:2128691-Rhodomonas_salina.2
MHALRHVRYRLTVSLGTSRLCGTTDPRTAADRYQHQSTDCRLATLSECAVLTGRMPWCICYGPCGTDGAYGATRRQGKADPGEAKAAD